MAMSVVYTTVNGQILHENRGGVVSHFVSDPLGSVVMVRDNSGNTVYEAEYDPYGNVQSETGTNPSEFGYVGTLGYVKDSASSLYVRARYLLTNFGRWLTKDPLWPSEPGFVYADSSPAQVPDPSGRTTSGKRCGAIPSIDKEAREYLEKLNKCVKECMKKEPEQFKKCFKKCFGEVAWGKLKDYLISAICCLNAGLLADSRGQVDEYGWDPCGRGDHYNQQACCDYHFCVNYANFKKTYHGRPIPIAAFSESAFQAQGQCGCSSYTGPNQGNSECNDAEPCS